MNLGLTEVFLGRKNRNEPPVPTPTENRQPPALTLVNPEQIATHLWRLHKGVSQERGAFDIVFVHGLQKSEDNDAWISTWTTRPDDHTAAVCWPQVWLPNCFPNANVYSIKYDASLTEWSGKPQRLEVLGHTIAQEMASEFGSLPLILVGHSLGGLLIKQILTVCGKQGPDISSFLALQQSLSCCFWYGVPHQGAPLAGQAGRDLTGLLRFAFDLLGRPSDLVNDLAPLSNYLTNLQQSYQGLSKIYKHYDYYFAETQPMYNMNDLIVPLWSAVNGSDPLNYVELDKVNHVNVCKPVNEVDTIFLRLVHKVNEKLEPFLEAEEYAKGRIRTATTIGRETILKDMESYLVKASGQCVVLVQGMGGVGKTTLVQDLIHCKGIHRHFQCISFQHVGLKLNPEVERGLHREVLARLFKIRAESVDHLSVEEVRERAIRELNKKQQRPFLLVFDNVWSSEVAKRFNYPLDHGSAIIFTTRNPLERELDNCKVYHLDQLDDDNAYKVFLKSAGALPQPIKESEELARQVVKRCAGLPLALEVAGRVLKNKEIGRWKGFVKKDVAVWEDTRENTVLDRLKMSYANIGEDLQLLIRTLSSSLSPGDTMSAVNSDQDMWIQLWSNLPKLQRGSRTDIVAQCKESLETLLDYGFVSREELPGIGFILRVHDMFLELSKELAKEDEDLLYFHVHQDLEQKENARHFACKPTGNSLPEDYDIIFEGEHCFMKLKMLRLLSVCTCPLPPQIGVLEHLHDLRYISFAYCTIQSLPDAISSLSRLCTLDLRATYITRLPETFTQLTRLKYLDLRHRLYEETMYGPDQVSQRLAYIRAGWNNNIPRVLPKQLKDGQFWRFKPLTEAEECSGGQAAADPDDVHDISAACVILNQAVAPCHRGYHREALFFLFANFPHPSLWNDAEKQELWAAGGKADVCVVLMELIHRCNESLAIESGPLISSWATRTLWEWCCGPRVLSLPILTPGNISLLGNLLRSSTPSQVLNAAGLLRTLAHPKGFDGFDKAEICVYILRALLVQEGAVASAVEAINRTFDNYDLHFLASFLVNCTAPTDQEDSIVVPSFVIRCIRDCEGYEQALAKLCGIEDTFEDSRSVKKLAEQIQLLVELYAAVNHTGV